jgi:hypothetical protein
MPSCSSTRRDGAVHRAGTDLGQTVFAEPEGDGRPCRLDGEAASPVLGDPVVADLDHWSHVVAEAAAELANACDAVLVADAGDRAISTDDPTEDDRAALGWAVSTDHPTGVLLLTRSRNGGSGVLAAELAAVHQDWEIARRPVPERHVYRTSVTFVDGTEVTGVTYRADDPYARDEEPSFGLYLDERWKPPWPHAHVDWLDFGLPADVDALRAALGDLVDRARNNSRVEIGCLGGHGRTGTALACLAVLSGTPPDEAVAWVRANYCTKAVETDEQAQFVADFQP